MKNILLNTPINYMLRKTTEEFINQANKIHKNKYDYTDTIFNGYTIKVKVKSIN